MTASLYKEYKNQVRTERCSSCMGYGKLYEDGPDDKGFECEECLGTGLDFSYDYQEDREFLLNLLKVLQDENSWKNNKKHIMRIIELNPAVDIIEMEHKDNSYMLVFRSHACYIDDGKLVKFF